MTLASSARPGWQRERPATDHHNHRHPDVLAGVIFWLPDEADQPHPETGNLYLLLLCAP